MMVIRRTLVLALGSTALMLVALAAAILVLSIPLMLLRKKISSSISSSRQHLPAAGRRTPNDSRRWKLK